MGDDFVYALRPEVVAGLQVRELRSLQFSAHKAESVIAVADAVASGRLDQQKLSQMGDAEAMAALTGLRGIGTWSSEWILVRSLGRSLVVAGDLGVRKGVALAYLGKSIAGEAEVRQIVAHWGVHATAAQAIIVYALSVDAEKAGKGP